MTEHFDDEGWRDEIADLPEEPEQLNGHRPLRLATGRETRPDLVVSTDVHVNAEKIAEALRGDPEIFKRANELTHVIRTDEEDAVPGLAPGSPVLRPVPLSWLLNRTSRAVKCVVRRKDKKGNVQHVPVPPPTRDVRAVLEQGTWSGVRDLRGVLEAPSLRPDGTIIQDPGYDRATGCLYVPNADYPAVDEHPTHDDARAALAVLLDVFADFPYASPHHASVPIAALLTVLARPAIRGAVPAFLFDASTRGSGKTLQCDVVSSIATGRTAARANYPEKDEELEKVLAAYAMAGAQLILLDNVTRMFGGGPIDAVLTCRDDVEFRILGKTETKRLPWRAEVMVSGNQLLLGEDTTRRSMIARLESPLENPEERTDFRHPNLLEHIRAARPRLIHAAMTVLRSYTAHGHPDTGGGIWGSFEEWSRLIPRAIVWAGGADPLLARATQAAAVSDAKRNLLVLIDGLRRLTPDAPLGASAILSSLYPTRDPHDGPPAPDGYDDLRETIEGETNCPAGRKPDAKRFGRWLLRARGRVVGGWCVDRVQDMTSNAAKWRVVLV